MAVASTPMGTAILADAPTKYHSFQDDQLVEVANGSQVADESGNNHPTTVRFLDLSGAVQPRSKVYSNDPLLPALPVASGRNWASAGYYDASNAQPFLELGAAGFESTETTGITFEAWSYIDGPGWGEKLLTIVGSTGTWRVAIQQDGTTNIESAGNDLVTAAQLTGPEWKHIGVIITPARAVTLIVNGQATNAGTIPAGIGTVQRITLWKNIDNPSKDFGGGISHLAMWNTAKTVAMIQAHYNAGKVDTGRVLQRGTYHHAKKRSEMLAPYPMAASVADDRSILMLEHWSQAGTAADMQKYKAIGSDGTILTNAGEASASLGISNAQWAADAEAVGYPYMTQPGSGQKLTQPEVAQGGKPAARAPEEEKAGHYSDILDPAFALIGANEASFMNFSWDYLDAPDRDFAKRNGDYAKPLASLDGYTHAANNDCRSKLGKIFGLSAEQVHTCRATRLIMERTSALYGFSGAKLLHQFISTGHTYETYYAGIITPEEMRGDCWATILAGGTPLWFNKAMDHRDQAGNILYPQWSASTQYDRISTVIYNGQFATPYIDKPAVGVAPSMSSGWVVGWQSDGAALDDKGKFPGATRMMKTVRDELQQVALLHNAGGYTRYKPHADLVARYWPDANAVDSSKPGPVMLVMQDVPESGTYSLTLPDEMKAATSITDQSGTSYPISTSGTIAVRFDHEYDHLLLQAVSSDVTTTPTPEPAPAPVVVEPTTPTVPVNDSPIFPSVDAAGRFLSALVQNSIRVIVSAEVRAILSGSTSGTTGTTTPTTSTPTTTTTTSGSLGAVVHIGDSLTEYPASQGMNGYISPTFIADEYTQASATGTPYVKGIAGHLILQPADASQPDTLQMLDDAAATGITPDTVVLRLGTNTRQDESSAWQALDAAGRRSYMPPKTQDDVRQVIAKVQALWPNARIAWVNVADEWSIGNVTFGNQGKTWDQITNADELSYFTAVNRVIKAEVDKLGSKGHVVDYWNWFGKNHPAGWDYNTTSTAWFDKSDGTHPIAAGVQASYDFITSDIAQWATGSRVTTGGTTTTGTTTTSNQPTITGTVTGSASDSYNLYDFGTTTQRSVAGSMEWRNATSTDFVVPSDAAGTYDVDLTVNFGRTVNDGGLQMRVWNEQGGEQQPVTSGAWTKAATNVASNTLHVSGLSLQPGWTVSFWHVVNGTGSLNPTGTVKFTRVGTAGTSVTYTPPAI